jgi:hypothetical protein
MIVMVKSYIVSCKKNRVFSGKSGQFYLIAAFIFVFLLYSLSSSTLYFTLTNDAFDELKSNYITEGNIVINEAINEGIDPFVRLDDFTRKYFLYSSTRNVDLRLVYIISSEGHLKIVNYLNKDINVYYKGQLINECVVGTCNPLYSSNVAEYYWYPEITLKFDDKEYSYEFSDSKDTEFKVLFRADIRK